MLANTSRLKSAKGDLVTGLFVAPFAVVAGAGFAAQSGSIVVPGARTVPAGPIAPVVRAAAGGVARR